MLRHERSRGRDVLQPGHLAAPPGGEATQVVAGGRTLTGTDILIIEIACPASRVVAKFLACRRDFVIHRLRSILRNCERLRNWPNWTSSKKRPFWQKVRGLPSCGVT